MVLYYIMKKNKVTKKKGANKTNKRNKVNKRNKTKKTSFNALSLNRSMNRENIKFRNSALTTRDRIAITKKIFGGTLIQRTFSFGELDNGLYEGQILNNKRNGKGKMTYKNKSNGRQNGIYDGDWDNNSRDGQGKMIFENNDIYEGTWKNDEMVGEGKIVKSDGNVYKGTWNATGDSWYGRWGEGARHMGEMKYANGDNYEGNWEDHFKNGFGKMNYDNGDYYEGFWDQDFQLGQGKMIFQESEEVFEGTWLLNGSVTGKMTYPNGDEYIGEMMYNRGELIQHGQGVMIYDDETRNEGIWRFGIREGHRNEVHIPEDTTARVAYEVHHFAARIDVDDFFNILNEFKDFKNEDIIMYVKTKFTDFINKKFDEDLINGEEKHFGLDSKTKLFENIDSTLTKLSNSSYSNEDKVKNIIGRSVDFVMKQDNVFIDLYIKTLVHDCVKAHIAQGEEAYSCVAGIVERFYMTIGSTVQNICLERDCTNNEKYTEILRLFFIPDFNDFVRQWVDENSNDKEEWSDELKGSGDIKRREHFVTFMRTKYEKLGLLNTFNIDKIEKEASDYAAINLFKNDLLQLGGKKKRKKHQYRVPLGTRRF
jgi:hypothetical protein